MAVSHSPRQSRNIRPVAQVIGFIVNAASKIGILQFVKSEEHVDREKNEK